MQASCTPGEKTGIFGTENFTVHVGFALRMGSKRGKRTCRESRVDNQTSMQDIHRRSIFNVIIATSSKSQLKDLSESGHAVFRYYWSALYGSFWWKHCLESLAPEGKEERGPKFGNQERPTQEQVCRLDQYEVTVNRPSKPESCIVLHRAFHHSGLYLDLHIIWPVWSLLLLVPIAVLIMGSALVEEPPLLQRWTPY